MGDDGGTTEMGTAINQGRKGTDGCIREILLLVIITVTTGGGHTGSRAQKERWCGNRKIGEGQPEVCLAVKTNFIKKKS